MRHEDKADADQRPDVAAAARVSAEDDHREHRAEAARRHHQPRLRRRVAEGLLQKDRIQDRGAVEREGQEDYQHHRQREVHVLEDRQIDDRVLGVQLVIDQHRQRDERGGRAVDDPRAGEPVGALAAIEHDFAEPERDEQAQRCRARSTRPRRRLRMYDGSSTKRYTMNAASVADRHVDVKIPAPAPRVGDIAADSRAHDRRDHHPDSPHRHRHRLLARRKGLHQDRLRQRHHRGAGRALHQAEENDLVERLRDAAQRRRHDEHRDRRDEVALAPEALGDPSGHRDHDSRGDQVGRDDPRDLVDARGEAALHMRQRDVDDRAVEHLEHGAEHHGERDHPLARRGKLVDLVRRLGNRFRRDSHRRESSPTVQRRRQDAKDYQPQCGQCLVLRLLQRGRRPTLVFERSGGGPNFRDSEYVATRHPRA